MKFYAVIDTNVLVSALLAKHEDSSTVTVVGKLFDSTVVPVFSKSILEEYSEILHRMFGYQFAETVVAGISFPFKKGYTSIVRHKDKDYS